MDNLSVSNLLAALQHIALWALPVVFAITVHEVAHGWVAKKYGDNTASMLGRLTLNPIKHIDLVGSIIVPGLLLMTGTNFVFGWAKPVPVDPRHFKNPRADMAVVALAGPVSNIIMAIIWALLVRIGFIIGTSSEIFASLLIHMGSAGISINLMLALLNLLPIPPLDGSRILSWLLPGRLAWYYSQLERYGFIILLILLYNNWLSVILAYPLFIAEKFFVSLAGIPSY
jgi:Zn-dependent protease